MPHPDRILSLAAGTVRDATRLGAIAAAAAAGFDAVGLRFDLDEPTGDEVSALRARLTDVGLFVLDVEVVRLSPDWNEDLEHRLIEWAHEIGAWHLLVVSDDPDHARTVDGLQRVSQRCQEAGLSAVLEFMRFTHPRTLGQAVALAREVGPPLGGVLVDPLHLARSGGDPDELAGLEPALFPYAQLCDAVNAAPLDDRDGLIHEARHSRLLPGEGALPLSRLLEGLPASIPLSVEVQSDALEQTSDPNDRARMAMDATQRVLASAGATI